MSLALVGSFAGGIGLFLLGMRLMTEGLRLAAGEALRHILAQWTSTPLRGLFSGVLITALVQSSSAVTVATIGFVNAGLLNLGQSVAVVYGTNLGTTVTSWLVALAGFKIDVGALAMPLIGGGMLLTLTNRGGRAAPLGQALAGFGLFFLGIGVLKEAFEGLGAALPLHELARNDFFGLLLFVGIGILLTLLTQSSSAAIALTLSAVVGGVVPLAAGAAAVIGANVGTTSTAVFAAIGATANAKRVAAAHVLFNVVAALAALLLLTLLVVLLPDRVQALEVADYAVLLAIFHTLSKVLGVALLWGPTPRLVRFLQGRFRGNEENVARPYYLDANVAATPSLALDALVLELGRVSGIARGMALGALSTEREAGTRPEADRRDLEALVEAVVDVTSKLQKSSLPSAINDALPNVLRTARYYQAVADLAVELGEHQAHLPFVECPELAEPLARFRRDAVNLMRVDPLTPDSSLAGHQQQLEVLLSAYQQIKALLLRAGTDQRLKVWDMVAQLDQYSLIRRMLEQAVKGADYLSTITVVVKLSRERPEPEPLAEEAA